MFEQQYAMTMLLIMTVTNVFLGIVMIAGFIPDRIRNVACFLCNVWYDLEV
jgi:hypothetical protein